MKNIASLFQLPPKTQKLLEKSSKVIIPQDKAALAELSLGGNADTFEVVYTLPNKKKVLEATVIRCKNGIAVNYVESYMRRRDPETMVIADNNPTDKTKFNKRFKEDYPTFEKEVFDWLSAQELLVLPFYTGGDTLKHPSLLIAPVNAAFFAASLAMLQGMIPANEIPKGFSPKTIIYLAPIFRHTHCDGKQIVVHNRGDVHEILSLNLYPGPSAKKGIYGVLLTIGDREKWTTIHGSTVKMITPYDNEFVIVHEGASGGGKSEMLEHPHRASNGQVLLGHNTVTQESRYIPLVDTCALHPVTDDMALCPPQLQNNSKKLVVTDAEAGWFVRINHITHYGTDPHLERLCTHPNEPLVFLNLQAVPGATCLIWEHTEDTPGKRCPNPRVILPRHIIPHIVNKPVEVDVRSFGVRTPPCTKELPTYGILGIMHLLPPSLAWLWRLVSPRGHGNPSITDTAGMSSEGVGSYWPFATGKQVDQANILLKQIADTPLTRYCLCPNQNIGAWQVSFMPQWLAREYLARHGNAKFKEGQIIPSRCPLLGFSLNSMHVEGVDIPIGMLQVDKQPEVGVQAYDEGANILKKFFHKELSGYLKESSLDPLGRKIIECCLANGSIEDYQKLIKA